MISNNNNVLLFRERKEARGGKWKEGAGRQRAPPSLLLLSVVSRCPQENNNRRSQQHKQTNKKKTPVFVLLNVTRSILVPVNQFRSPPLPSPQRTPNVKEESGRARSAEGGVLVVVQAKANFSLTGSSACRSLARPKLYIVRSTIARFVPTYWAGKLLASTTLSYISHFLCCL